VWYEDLTSSARQSLVIGAPAVAATVVIALAACGTATKPTAPSSGSPEVSCQSAYVDWLYRSRGVTCAQANAVAAAIFMGDDGDERTSFTQEDFAPLPTVNVPGVGYVPARTSGLWHCRYSTRRSTYGVAIVRFVYATCRLGAHVVKMTTAMDNRAISRNS